MTTTNSIIELAAELESFFRENAWPMKNLADTVQLTSEATPWMGRRQRITSLNVFYVFACVSIEA